MSVFSGVYANVSRHSQRPPVDSPKLENRIYITLTYSEGDNLQYNQHRMRILWDDDARGEVPANWSTSTLLSDTAPVILSHYQRTATENDHLCCGPSGLGYMYPRPWPDETLGKFTEQTARYMRRTNMDTIYLLNRENGQNVPLEQTTADQYADDIDLRGVTYNFGGNVSAETEIRNGELPLAAGPLVSDADRLSDVVESQIPDDWNGERPLFIAVGLLAWNITPSDLADSVTELNSDYEIVTGDQFFDLVRRAYED